jgi:hypothetical protein
VLQSSKIAKANNLDFNVWSHSPDDLLVLTFEILQETRLTEEFQMDPVKLKYDLNCAVLLCSSVWSSFF